MLIAINIFLYLMGLYVVFVTVRDNEEYYTEDYFLAAFWPLVALYAMTVTAVKRVAEWQKANK